MKTEEDLNGGVTVWYEGELFVTGNRRHGEVDLYRDRVFIWTVKISRVELANMRTI